MSATRGAEAPRVAGICGSATASVQSAGGWPLGSPAVGAPRVSVRERGGSSARLHDAFGLFERCSGQIARTLSSEAVGRLRSLEGLDLGRVDLERLVALEAKFAKEGLTFDDVLLVPGDSAVLPNDVSTATRFTREIALQIPVV